MQGTTNTMSVYGTLVGNWMYDNQELTLLAILLWAAVLYCILSFLNHRGVKMEQQRLSQRSIIADCVTDALDDAYLAGKLSSKARHRWAKHFGKALDLPDLLPRKGIIKYPRKPKKVSSEAIKAKMEHNAVVANTSDAKIPGPKPGDDLVVATPKAKRFFAKAMG